MNHPNRRGRGVTAHSNPTPEAIRQARLALNLTPEQAAALVYENARRWMKWETDEGPRMHPAVWQLFKERAYAPGRNPLPRIGVTYRHTRYDRPAYIAGIQDGRVHYELASEEPGHKAQPLSCKVEEAARLFDVFGPDYEDGPDGKRVQLDACPHCGSTYLDAAGWMGHDDHGPACLDCGSTAESADKWNKRATV